MDETVEEDVVEEIKEQEIEDPEKKKISQQKALAAAAPPQIISEISESTSSNSEIPTLEADNSTKLSFNDLDSARDINNNEEIINAPKNDARLEQISEIRHAQRKADEADAEDDDEPLPKLKIFDQNASLGNLDVHVIEEPTVELIPDLLIDDIEVLA